MSLPGFSVRQAVLVNVLFMVLMFAGYVSFDRLPIDFFPDISFNHTSITTVWSGASADEVERLITTKIENEIRDIADIKEMVSQSRANYSSIEIEWKESISDAEYESAINDLRAAIERVDDLPPDAEDPYIRELSVGESYPIMMVVVADVAELGELTLTAIADDIRSEIDDLPGIRKATMRGEREREVHVIVHRDEAWRYDLSLVEIAARIRGQNLNLPAGTFTGSEGEATLRATGDYQSIDEILATVLREDPNGTYVRLRDVAKVEETLEKRRFYGRYNGNPSLVIGITKEDEADLTQVAAGVRGWIERNRATVPEGIELSHTWDTSEWVSERMTVLRDNLLTGVVFVMVILWFTIGFRNATLTIIAIPFSFLTAFILFPLMDITINSLSLIGMLLVSGMLVDDAIIVLENIYRRIEEAEPLRQAIVSGTEQVMWPVVSAVSTTCAAFFPLLLVEGTSGEFMSILPKTVIACLCASLFECLLVLPAHYYDLGSRHAADQRPTPRGRLGHILGIFGAMHLRVDRGIGRLRESYLKALDVVLQHRASFGALSVALFLLAVGVATHLPVVMFQSEFNNFFVVLESPTDFGIDQTNSVFHKVERELDAMLGETLVDYSTFVGNAMTGDTQPYAASNVAMAFCTIVDREDYILAPEKAIALVQDRLDRLREANPQQMLELRALTPRNGPPVGKPVAVRLQGDDYSVSKAIALEMEQFLRNLPGISNVEDNLREGPREIRLLVDEERAGQHGLSFEAIAGAFRAANDGVLASSFRAPDEEDEFDIRVLPAVRYREDVRSFLEARVRAPGGYLVKLADVAGVEFARGYQSLAHYDGTRAVTVYADVDEDQATSVSANRALETRFANLALQYPEVEVVYGGEFQETAEAFANLRAVFPVALLLIYMILAAQFRSYLQPLVVATAIPFGLMGVIAGVGVMGYTVSFGLLYATIGLTGVVVNDSLVMVDFINRARNGGMPLLEAVRQSGAQRLRPILLTTFTTVLALLPMALGLAGVSKSYGPFAAALTFGLMVAMFGTLFVVPLAYTSLILLQERWGIRTSPVALSVAASETRVRSRPVSTPGEDEEESVRRALPDR
jgi:HAE1 family hydrophobic/amphiphilic exporter-1